MKTRGRRSTRLQTGLETATVILLIVCVGVLVFRPARSHSTPPALRTMTTSPVAGNSNADSALRLVPPASHPCTTKDLTVTAIEQSPQTPPNQSYPALARVTSTAPCILGQVGEITPLHPDGHRAAPPVNLAGGNAPEGPISIGPGDDGLLTVDWFFDPCPTSPTARRSTLATSFSYDLSGAKGHFALLHPLRACPMGVTLQAEDSINPGTHVLPIEDMSQVALFTPARVPAGHHFNATVTIYDDATVSGIFVPCPTLWTLVASQTAPAQIRFFQLHCAGMQPIGLGDRVTANVDLILPAGLPTQTVDVDVGFGSPPSTNPSFSEGQSGPYAAAQLTATAPGPPLQPVAPADLPAPPPPVPLLRTVSPLCTAAQLTPAGLAPHGLGPGVGTHADYFTLTNTSKSPCTLDDTTPVLLEAAGVPALPLPQGASEFSDTVDGELEPGETTQIQFEFPNDCTGSGATPITYSTAVIELPSGPLVVPRPIDDMCGVSTGGAGLNARPPNGIPSGATPLYQAESIDAVFQPGSSEQDGVIIIDGPAALPRGKTTAVEVTMQGQADWTKGCPGYVITIDQIQTRHGLPCTITHVLEDIPATYTIDVDVPADVPLGTTTLRFELLSGLVPTGESQVTIVDP